ncbi:MAG: hypothetical protein IJ759_07885 [Bacteroidales bacterium]|nr:hypothetical protein [Bacteroidales bacterium]MBR1775424.1 hypothetical protein [Bacteroidales bacterium]
MSAKKLSNVFIVVDEHVEDGVQMPATNITVFAKKEDAMDFRTNLLKEYTKQGWFWSLTNGCLYKNIESLDYRIEISIIEREVK